MSHKKSNPKENLKSKKEYLRRIYKVQDYIEAHLTDSLSLEELADVAGFSKYHFHRIFTGVLHETLSQYINRLKLERAEHLLVHRPDMSITKIAYYLGFTDSAIFSRTFRNHYKLSPTEYRNQNSKNCKDSYKISQYNEGVSNREENYENKSVQGNVKIVVMESLNIAYVRHIGAYSDLAVAISKLLERLFYQADKQKLLDTEQPKILTIYHDNPEFTSKDHLRTSLCIAIPNHIKVEENDEIGVMTIPSGKYVVGHFEIFQQEYSMAWDFMYNEWLTNSGYQPSDSSPFEVYLNIPETHPQHKHLVDIYLPIEPLFQ